MKKRDFTLWFLRRFARFRAAEAAADGLSAAVKRLRKESESDAAYIDSLNRYIEALEGKAAAQAETAETMEELRRECLRTAGELRERLRGALPKERA